jgi:hypothetical protein
VRPSWFRQAHFRALTEHLPSFVWSANADGITDYYNLTLLDHVGKTRGEMRPAVWFEAIHPEDYSRRFAPRQGIDDGETGSATFVQRFSATLQSFVRLASAETNRRLAVASWRPRKPTGAHRNAERPWNTATSTPGPAAAAQEAERRGPLRG